MRKFTKRDLDRTWSLNEATSLSEGELTKLAFLRDYKNFIFFLPIAFILYYISSRFWIIGKIVGWIGIVNFVLFALWGLMNTFTCFISLFVTSHMNKVTLLKNTFWKLLQLLISFGNFAIYVALAYLVYIGMYGSLSR